MQIPSRRARQFYIGVDSQGYAGRGSSVSLSWAGATRSGIPRESSNTIDGTRDLSGPGTLCERSGRGRTFRLGQIAKLADRTTTARRRRRCDRCVSLLFSWLRTIQFSSEIVTIVNKYSIQLLFAFKTNKVRYIKVIYIIDV